MAQKQSVRRYPEPAVGAFITDGTHRVLLVLSRKWTAGVWTVPGGHIELGEHIADAVVRETREEVGLQVTFHGVFSVREAVFPEHFIRKKHFIFLECDCRTVRGVPRVDGDEIREACWFTFAEAFRLHLEANTRAALEILEKRLQTG